MKRLAILATLLAALPGAAQAHDAFGDLGPFYQGLMHPLLDPVQALLLIGLAVLLARQPSGAVRVAYAALVMAAGVAAILLLTARLEPPALRSVGILAACLGVFALAGLRLPTPVLAMLAMSITAVAVVAGDTPTEPRAAMLAASGAWLGASLLVLLMWGAIVELQSRISPLAGAVAGSWVAAVGVMAAVLPA